MAIRIEREIFSLPSAVAPDEEVFAIGDIHGRSDLLAALLSEAGSEPKRLRRRTIVFLGDLIDRGPDSLGVITLASEAAARLGADERIGLMGNHEAMMRLALDATTRRDVALDAFETWTANGGGRVIAEFLDPNAWPRGYDALLEATRSAAPAAVLNWLHSLRANWRSGGLLFVHGGVNPRLDLEGFLAAPWNEPLAELDEDRHWAWVRTPFLKHRPGPEGFSGYFVVHGHTPNDAGLTASHEAQIKRFRLNLDGGSAQTGVAKMAIIRGAEATVVTARGPRNRELTGKG
jgi:serine/threonine protein phosphatase 1